MYFIITPPEETVERGWQRGLQRGRYKSVEDFLGFSIEAYVGMPKLLFKWLAYRRPRFNYVFLDNSVAKGSSPKTIAQGSQEQMTIFNPLALINIERYQKINLKAQTPAQVYPASTDFSVANNSGFLRQCLSRIELVNLVDEASGICYLKVLKGEVTLMDKAKLNELIEQDDMAQVLQQIAPNIMAES